MTDEHTVTRPYRVGSDRFATEPAARLAVGLRRERGEPASVEHLGPCARHRDEPADEWHACDTPGELLERNIAPIPPPYIRRNERP